MEYKQFKEALYQGLKETFPSPYEVGEHQVKKNNGRLWDSFIVLGNGKRFSPQFYVKQYYEEYVEGKSMEAILEEIQYAYTETIKQGNYDLDLHYETCKDKIIYRVVSFEKNREILQEIPYIPFLDLAITFHCVLLKDEEGIGSIRVTNQLLQKWELDQDTLFSVAQKNTVALFPATHKLMNQVLVELLQNRGGEEEMVKTLLLEMEEKPSSQVHILSNQMGVNGASVVLYPGFLEQIRQEVGKDFYLLPSSIHEMLLVPFSVDMGWKQLQEMVREVNAECVEEEEILSEEVYCYKKASGILQRCQA